MKRGRLFELLPSVRVREPAIASALALNPVTLRTVQETLGVDQAIVRPIFSDSLAAVMVVGKHHLQIVGSIAAFDSLHTPGIAVEGIRRELAEGKRIAPLKGGRESGLNAHFFVRFFPPCSPTVALWLLQTTLFRFICLFTGPTG